MRTSLSAMLRAFVPVAVVAGAGISAPAAAELLDAAAGGFTLRHEVMVAAPRSEVYGKAVDDVGRWWSSDHTVSGDAANLYITTELPGCFCERLGDAGGLVHLSVTFVNPGVMLRFSGGLGPLGLMGVAGNMTWEFEDAEGGTFVTLQYAVGGYLDGGLNAVAAAVDAVLGEQMARLARYAETGSAD